MALEQHSLDVLRNALHEMDCQFAGLPAFADRPTDDRISGILTDVARRMADNYPYFHPLYAGQMLKPPHPVARAAYALAMWINPNNHALDGGRASSAMEKEAVAALASMCGWQRHLGHLASGGTMANLEALWVAGRLHSGKRVIASEQAHYTHERISGVLGLPFSKVPCDSRGKMDCAALQHTLEAGDVGCVVVTLGTTAVGAMDPLPRILELRDKYAFRVHVDAAYGGYFQLIENLSAESLRIFERLGDADSIVIDPHKHGLQPYGCGCILFRDPAIGSLYKHDSPYTYFSSRELHLGEISLECSRAGASAVALWATQRLLPPVRGGEFAASLSASRRAAITLANLLQKDAGFVLPFQPELDIVVWAPRAGSASAASVLSQKIFDEAARRHLHLALAKLPVAFFADRWPELQRDQDHILCLRSVLMKPEHEAWANEIYRLLREAADSARTRV